MLLPDAPIPAAQTTASIAGVVVDQSGAAIDGATITLTDPTGLPLRKLVTTLRGEYSFDALPAGRYQVTIQAPGFAPFTSAPFLLAEQQTYIVPGQPLLLAAADTLVVVSADQSAEAEIQIHAAERQRVLGIIPNFYESFIFDAAPLSTRQKYSLAFRDTFDPENFIGTGLGAAIEQANNSFRGYGQGAAGYGKRYAALYGDGLFRDTMAHAVFPSIFHQDPRYFYQGTGTTKSRAYHAVSFAFVTRSDRTGKNVPNYSYVIANLIGGALSNAYYPHANRGPGLVFTNAAVGIAGQAGGALVEEFLLPYLTTHKAGKGKQPNP